MKSFKWQIGWRANLHRWYRWRFRINLHSIILSFYLPSIYVVSACLLRFSAFFIQIYFIQMQFLIYSKLYFFDILESVKLATKLEHNVSATPFVRFFFMNNKSNRNTVKIQANSIQHIHVRMNERNNKKLVLCFAATLRI